MPVEALFLVAMLILWLLVLPKSSRQSDGFDNPEARELHIRERRDGVD